MHRYQQLRPKQQVCYIHVNLLQCYHDLFDVHTYFSADTAAVEGGGQAAAPPAAVAPFLGEADDQEMDPEEDDNVIASYAAWKTFPVRVNGLPMDATTKDVETAFAKVSLVCSYQARPHLSLKNTISPLHTVSTL